MALTADTGFGNKFHHWLKEISAQTQLGIHLIEQDLLVRGIKPAITDGVTDDVTDDGIVFLLKETTISDTFLMRQCGGLDRPLTVRYNKNTSK